MCTSKQCAKFCKKRVVNCWVGCKTPGCAWAGCCRCPHGRCYTLMAVIGGFGGLFMNLYVVMSCFFQRITEINPVTGDPIPSTSHGYGLMAREIAMNMGESPDDANYQSCILYPREEYDYIKDFYMVTARNLAFLAGFLGLIAWVFFILSYCYLFTPWTMERWVMWTYLWAAVCMAFTMLMWGGSFCKENLCQVAPGTGYAISSFFTWLMLANQAKSMGQPPAVERPMPEPGGVEDDYWYDDDDERYAVDSDSDDEDELSDGNIEVFEDEIDDKGKPRKRKVGFIEPDAYEGQFQNSSRNAHEDENYEDMSEYMAPEDRYAKEQDERFLEYDQEQYQQQAQQQQQQQQPNQQTHPHWRQHPPQQPPIAGYLPAPEQQQHQPS